MNLLLYSHMSLMQEYQIFSYLLITQEDIMPEQKNSNTTIKILQSFEKYYKSKNKKLMNPESCKKQLELLEKILTENHISENMFYKNPTPKTITIQRVILQNFGGHSSLSVDFTNKTVFTISGSIGAGKSTILDAIYFALTGHSHKLGGNSLGDIVHQGNESGFVTLLLTVNNENITIKREFTKKKTKKNNILSQKISLSADNATTDVNITDEEKLAQLLGLSPEHIATTLILKQGGITALLEMGETELFNTVIDLDCFLQIFQVLSHTKDTLNSRFAETRGRLMEVEQHLQNQQNDVAHVEQIVNRAEDALLDAQTNLNNTNQEMQAIQVKIAEINQSIVDTVFAQLRQKTMQENKSHCPLCEQQLPHSFFEKANKELEIIQQLEQTQSLLKTLQETSAKQSREVYDREISLQKAQSQLNQLIQLTENMTDFRIQHDITMLSLENEIKETIKLRDHFAKRKSRFQSYLANELYQELCVLANPHISRLMGKNTKVSYITGKGFSFSIDKAPARIYKSFSGGEKTLFAIGLELAIREFLLKNANLDLKMLFVDEGFHIFKEDAGIQELIKSISTENLGTVGIITHNDKIISMTPENLVVSKDNALWRST